MSRPKPIILVILDAFGLSLAHEGNPVFAARKPTLDDIERNYPFTAVQASGIAVGLPVGEAGNSEVGHLTIGAGRVLHHHLPRIISSIHDLSFFKNEVLASAMEHTKTNSSRLHIAGLISSGSVHSYIDHVYAILDFASRSDVSEVYIHAFTDGKDAPQQEGAEFLGALEKKFQQDWQNVHIASVVGRFYGMDRDEKWDRTQKAYDLMTKGTGEKAASVESFLQESYAKGISDEFIEPAVIAGADGTPFPRISAGDALMFINFREDSMRQITHAFVDDVFAKFPRGDKIQNLKVVTLTDYEESLYDFAAFPSPDIVHTLSEVLSSENLRHFHIAETEKYAHVTYFFNGGRELPFEGEERTLIPSLEVKHMDEVPEMRSQEITEAILRRMDEFDVIIVNYANADMVGHSGNFPATVRAVEALDQALAQIMNAVMLRDGVMLVTGDHGGVEFKRNAISGEGRTEHSTNPVPLYIIGKQWKRKTPRTDDQIAHDKKEIGGILTDIAPTVLELVELRKPPDMTGTSLVSILKRQIG